MVTNAISNSVRNFMQTTITPGEFISGEVQLLSKICGFHNALFKDNSTWCQLFAYEDLNVAEYERELQHYWDESYGFPVNSRVACPLINDTFEYLERFTARSPSPM